MKRAWLVVQAQRHFGESKYDAALNALAAIEQLSPLTHAERALRYYLLVLKEDFDEAFDLLDELCRDTDQCADDDGRYINLYVRASRAHVEGDEVLRDALRRETLKLKPRKMTANLLPLD